MVRHRWNPIQPLELTRSRLMIVLANHRGVLLEEIVRACPRLHANPRFPEPHLHRGDQNMLGSLGYVRLWGGFRGGCGGRFRFRGRCRSRFRGGCGGRFRGKLATEAGIGNGSSSSS